jgi:hypothetical protein
MFIRLFLLVLAVCLMICLGFALIIFFENLFFEKEKKHKIDADFVKKLIEKNMFYLVVGSLISSDNGADKTYWERAKTDLTDIKNSLEELEVLGKDKYIKNVEDALKIVENELG